MYRAQRGHRRGTGVKAEYTGRWTQQQKKGPRGFWQSGTKNWHFSTTLKVINF